MKNEITRLAASLKLLEQALGTAFIKEEDHKIGGWNPEGTAGQHPLVLLWYKTREELAMAELTGSLPHSRWVRNTLLLGECLETLTNHPEYPERLEELKNLNTWQDTLEWLKEYAHSK